MSAAVHPRTEIRLMQPADLKSVAEIAAMLGVPLGVAEVIVGDLAEYGLVVVEPTDGDAGPDIQLLERVLSGLQNL